MMSPRIGARRLTIGLMVAVTFAILAQPVAATDASVARVFGAEAVDCAGATITVTLRIPAAEGRELLFGEERVDRYLTIDESQLEGQPGNPRINDGSEFDVIRWDFIGKTAAEGPIEVQYQVAVPAADSYQWKTTGGSFRFEGEWADDTNATYSTAGARSLDCTPASTTPASGNDNTGSGDSGGAAQESQSGSGDQTNDPPASNGGSQSSGDQSQTTGRDPSADEQAGDDHKTQQSTDGAESQADADSSSTSPTNDGYPDAASAADAADADSTSDTAADDAADASRDDVASDGGASQPDDAATTPDSDDRDTPGAPFVATAVALLAATLLIQRRTRL